MMHDTKKQKKTIYDTFYKLTTMTLVVYTFKKKLLRGSFWNFIIHKTIEIIFLLNSSIIFLSGFPYP